MGFKNTVFSHRQYVQWQSKIIIACIRANGLAPLFSLYYHLHPHCKKTLLLNHQDFPANLCDCFCISRDSPITFMSVQPHFLLPEWWITALSAKFIVMSYSPHNDGGLNCSARGDLAIDIHCAQNVLSTSNLPDIISVMLYRPVCVIGKAICFAAIWM